jgi:predicted nuclease of predicted toxin-antitoxin system
MIFWLDAQLSPQLAPWFAQHFAVTAYAVRDLGLRDATDRAIYDAARAAGVVVITKDRDFPDLLARLGPPPQVIWVTCGNTSNARMHQIFETLFPQALLLLQGGDPLVEITDLP